VAVSSEKGLEACFADGASGALVSKSFPPFWPGRFKMEVMSLTLEVECYAGYKANERPQRFRAALPNARVYEVKEVLDQWYGVGTCCFKVLADDGNVYILRHEEGADVWSLDAFRSASGTSG